MIKEIKMDFHVHTLVSCYGNRGFYENEPPISVHKLRNMMNAAFEREISFAVTDHNTAASFEALKRNEYNGEKILKKGSYEDLGCVLKFPKKGIYIIRGEEISTKDGHVLAVGIENAIRPGMDIADTCREIKKQSGIAIIAHPYFLNGVGENNIARLIESNNGLTDGIELNLRDLKRANDGKVHLLAARYDLSIFIGSDSHLSTDINEYGYSLIPIETFEKESGREIIEGIRNRPIIPYCKKGHGNTVLREAVRLSHKHADIIRHHRGIPLRY